MPVISSLAANFIIVLKLWKKYLVERNIELKEILNWIFKLCGILKLSSFVGTKLQFFELLQKHFKILL